MKLKEEWRQPIIDLEKRIIEINQGFDMMNIQGLTPTEIKELEDKRQKLTMPYRILLQKAKYLGYELTELQKRSNTIRPIFPL